MRGFAGLLAGLAGLVALAACGGDGGGDAAQERSPRAAAHGSWWRPRPGQAADWDWQIDGPFDLSARRQMFDLDLFELAPPDSALRYRDGATIEVPAGRLAGKVGELHARTPRPVVICYFDSGAYEHYRPDARRFPGYRPGLQDIPGKPRPPAPGSVIGWDTGWAGERWLDIREGSRAAFRDLIWARLDLAKRIGCDGVEPDQNNPLGNDPGFPITLRDQHSWYREVAAQAHRRGLSVGMKNGHDQPGSAAALADAFDWALPEECAQFAECAELRAFVERGKAVFAVDYRDSVAPATACRAHRRWGFDGLVKDEPPTAAFRIRC